MLDKKKAPQRPGPKRKCHGRAENTPGWLEVTSYATCVGGACVVGGSGEQHYVVVKNYSTLAYFFTVRGTCATSGVRYQDEGGDTKEWTPNEIFLSGTGRGSTAQREISRSLLAFENRDDETLEVAVSWRCGLYEGTDALKLPLTIQVDTRPAARS